MLTFNPEEKIERSFGKLTQAQLDAFKHATLSSFSGMNPAFPTVFRESEFEWLRRSKVDMRRLLHVDQEYQFLSPMTVGNEVVASTRVASAKERRNMMFCTLETEILCGTEMCIRGTTTFVIRGDES